MAETLLTVEQAAARLQLHTVTVRRHIERGQLRAIRKGRAVRIPESALLENAPLRGSRHGSPLHTQPLSARAVESPQVRAQAIIAGLKNPDYQVRNATIIALSSADARTRDLVEKIVARELEAIPDDADFSDWRALDGEAFVFPEAGSTAGNEDRNKAGDEAGQSQARKRGDE